MTEPTYRTEIKWLVGIGLRADGTLDRYARKDGEFKLVSSTPPTIPADRRDLMQEGVMYSDHEAGVLIPVGRVKE